jgi:uncharacterized protein (TIRG00374 family)
MSKKIFSTLFLLGIAAAGIIYYFNHRAEFYLITTVSVSALAALSCIVIIISLCNGLQLKILMNHYGMEIGFSQCYGISRASSFINLFLPIGTGASFKAVYLKKLLKFRYSSFIASMGITTVIKIMLYALIALLLLMVSDGKINMFLITVSGLVFSISLLFLFLGHKLKRLDITSSGHMRKVIDEWQKIKRDRETMGRLLMVGLILFLASGLNTYLSFRAFSIDISATASGTIAAFAIITGLLNLVPGNLGIREAIIILISESHGIGINESVHAAALGRLIQVIWTIILASFFRYNLSNKK